MQHAGWRTVVAVVAAGWFAIASMNLGSYSDQVALALIDLGRPILIGLAVLSLALVDVGWVTEEVKGFARSAAQPTT